MNFVLFSDFLVCEDGRVLKSIDLGTREVHPFVGTCISEKKIPHSISAFWSTLTHCYHASQGVLKKFDLRNSLRRHKPRAFLVDDHSTRLLMCEHNHTLYGAQDNVLYYIENGRLCPFKRFSSPVNCVISTGECLVVGVHKTLFYLQSLSDVQEWTQLITVEDEIVQVFGTKDKFYIRLQDKLMIVRYRNEQGSLGVNAFTVFSIPSISSLQVVRKDVNAQPTVYYSVGNCIRIFTEHK
jgi:hypothetical protein